MNAMYDDVKTMKLHLQQVLLHAFSASPSSSSSSGREEGGPDIQQEQQQQQEDEKRIPNSQARIQALPTRVGMVRFQRETREPTVSWKPRKLKPLQHLDDFTRREPSCGGIMSIHRTVFFTSRALDFTPKNI